MGVLPTGVPNCRAAPPLLECGRVYSASSRSKQHREPTLLRSSLAAAFSVVLATGIAQSAAAQDAAEQRLGTVHFETSCNETAQRRFDRGMRYQHSFWYRASKDIFEDVIKADPECAIAYWGIALSLLLNPHVPPPKDNLVLGAVALEKAKSTGAKTQRERDYI